MFSKIMKLPDALYNFLLPATCVVCQSTAKTPLNLCLRCINKLPILPKHCQQCAAFLPSSRHTLHKCGTCLMHPPDFDKIYALFPYEAPLPTLITELKFKKKLCHAKLFADLFLSKIKSDWYLEDSLPDLIIPVPLHLTRLSLRGFNQTIEIARPLASALTIPLDLELKRSLPTKPQTGLSRNVRRINIKNAFQSKRLYIGQHVVLLDDVVTTSSTISACARLLRHRGATRIDVWTVARRFLTSSYG